MVHISASILRGIIVCAIFFEVGVSSQSPFHSSGNDFSKAYRSLVDTGDGFLCPRDGLFSHATFCEKYYNCSSGSPTPEIWVCRTTANLLFSDQHNECNNAELVHCWGRIRPDNVSGTMRPPTVTTTTTMTPPTTTRPVSPPPIYNCTTNGAYPHPVFCEMYFDCWEGISTLLKCSNETLFDVEWKGCVQPEDVDCGHRIRPIPGPEFRCPADGADGEQYPDQNNCAAFYTCTNGLPVHQLCPTGLYFNKFLKVCDYPANVDCSDRNKSDKYE